MPSIYPLVKKDLKGYFDQPAGYILLVIFIGASSFLYFRTVFNTLEASLGPLFSVMPWMLAVFVAAATMRLVAEEQRDGTLETLLTQPIKVLTVLFAKLLSGFIFVSVGVLLTIAIPLTLQTAGDMDEGAIFAQYLGTLLLTASFVAIGLFTSSLTRNQIVAFMVGLTIMFVMMVGGLPLVTIALPSAAAVLVQDLSPLTHFSGISRGVLDLKDVVYFVALISTFLAATYLMIRGKSVSHSAPLYRNLQLGVGGLVVISLLAGWFGTSIQGRWDLTEEKLYTLSEAAEDILSDIDDIVTIKLFTSKDPPVQVSLTSREVDRFLSDLAAKSDGKVRVLRRFADEDDESAEEARRAFIPPVQFNVESQGQLLIKEGYLGVAMYYANRQEVIQYVESVEGLEYQVVSKLYRMTQKTPSELLFMYGHGEKRRDELLQTWRNQLELNYAVDEREFQLGLFEGFAKVLVVAGPTDYIEPRVEDEIDDFLARGGNALFLVDPVLVREEILSASENEFSLASYLERYGIDVRSDIVFDMRSNELVTFVTQYGQVTLPYPYWVRVPTVETKISGGVQSAVFGWPSSIELTGVTGNTVDVEITPLLTTLPTAGLDEEYRDISVQSSRLEGVSEAELGSRILAVAITGTRCPPFEPKCEKDPSKPFRIIVATDSDWISEPKVRQFPQHLGLAVNWIDWLTQEDALATVRSKGTTLRPLQFDSNFHRNLIQYGNIVGVPAALVVLGLLRYLLRRNATRKVYTRGE